SSLLLWRGNDLQVSRFLRRLLNTHGRALRLVSRKDFRIVVGARFERFPGKELVATWRQSTKNEMTVVIGRHCSVETLSVSLVRYQDNFRSQGRLGESIGEVAIDLSAFGTQRDG